jgi:hypothetical protein
MVYAMNIQGPGVRGPGVTPLDGDFSKVELVDYTRDGGMLNHTMGSGRPVRPEFVPTRMLWGLDRSDIPDFEDSHALNISDRAKSIIEQFEPQVHQFLPVAYWGTNNTLIEKRWFLVPCQRIDSMDHDRTTFVMHVMRQSDGSVYCKYWRPVCDLVNNNETALIPKNLTPKTQSESVFSRQKIGTRHMWMDMYILGRKGPFISNELADAFVAGGLTGLMSISQETV